MTYTNICVESVDILLSDYDSTYKINEENWLFGIFCINVA